MSRLEELPLKILILISGYLPKEKDISSFVQTNRHLCRLLHLYLCQHNVRHNGGSALLWAARNGESQLTRRLLDAGADISSFDSDAERCHDFRLVSVSEGVIGGTSRPGNINDILKRIKNPLLLAAQGSHITTLDLILSERRARQICSPAQLRTVLHWAIRSHDRELVERVISRNAPLDPAGNQNQALSALGVAVESHYDAIIPQLLELGARRGRSEYPGPLDQAIMTEQPQVVELLLKYSEWLTSDLGLVYIAWTNNMTVLQLLIDNGLDLNPWGVSAFFAAILYGNHELAEFMLDKGLNANFAHEIIQRGNDTYWSSPIGLAIRFRHFDILKLLIARGLSPEQRDIEFAVKNGYEDDVALLSKFSEHQLDEKDLLADHVSHEVRWRRRRDAEDKSVPLYFPFIFDPSAQPNV